MQNKADRVARRANTLLDARRKSKGITGDLVSILDAIPHGEARDYAKKLGISAQYFSDIRNGRREISANVLERLVNLK